MPWQSPTYAWTFCRLWTDVLQNHCFTSLLFTWFDIGDVSNLASGALHQHVHCTSMCSFNHGSWRWVIETLQCKRQSFQTRAHNLAGV